MGLPTIVVNMWTVKDLLFQVVKEMRARETAQLRLRRFVGKQFPGRGKFKRAHVLEYALVADLSTAEKSSAVRLRAAQMRKVVAIVKDESGGEVRFLDEVDAREVSAGSYSKCPI